MRAWTIFRLILLNFKLPFSSKVWEHLWSESAPLFWTAGEHHIMENSKEKAYWFDASSPGSWGCSCQGHDPGSTLPQIRAGGNSAIVAVSREERMWIVWTVCVRGTVWRRARLNKVRHWILCSLISWTQKSEVCSLLETTFHASFQTKEFASSKQIMWFNTLK